MISLEDGAILSQRQLNRTLLARQHLLERSSMSASAMIAHLVGMQSQVPTDPYTGLWTRLHDFGPDDLSRLMLDRDAVRASLMRGMIHVATRDDYLRLQPVMMPLHERAIPRIAGTRIVPAEVVPAILAAGAELLRSVPMTSKALGAAIHGRFPEHLPASLAAVCRFGLPLVQVTPRGIWGASHQPTWALASEWLAEPVPDDPTPDEVIARYLAAFGPATIADIQAWSGLTGLRVAIARMRPNLRTYRNEQGQEVFDVPGAPVLPGDVPAPVRFLPEFDNALLSHRDRTRIISEERRKVIGTTNGRFQATYLLDGFVAGTWRIECTGDCATMVVRPFESHSREEMADLEEEGRALLAFLSDAGSRHVMVERDDRGVNFLK